VGILVAGFDDTLAAVAAVAAEASPVGWANAGNSVAPCASLT